MTSSQKQHEHEIETLTEINNKQHTTTDFFKRELEKENMKVKLRDSTLATLIEKKEAEGSGDCLKCESLQA